MLRKVKIHITDQNKFHSSRLECKINDQNYFTDFQGTYTFYFIVIWEIQNSIINYILKTKTNNFILLQNQFE